VNAPGGQTYFDELLWVHGMVRRDLAKVRELAAELGNGMPAGEVQAELEDLRANGPLWHLKLNCLHYCRFVHAHHGAEDRMLFPALRASHPDLVPAIDQLESEHRQVSGLLDTVEAAAKDLPGDDDGEGRARVADALEELADHLLRHLEFEEESLAEAMRAMKV
jgi:hypothetical protein